MGMWQLRYMAHAIWLIGIWYGQAKTISYEVSEEHLTNISE